MAFSLKSLFRPKGDALDAYRLYGAIVDQARRIEFYRDFGVPDSPAGRFSLIALHGFLVMERLARDAEVATLAQAVFDAMFADMDRNLREMGVGDLSVGKKVKALAQHFYGLSDAVRRGLEGSPAELQAALSRNIYGETPVDQHAVRVLAAYVRAATGLLAGQASRDLVRGRVVFAALSAETDDVVTG